MVLGVWDIRILGFPSLFARAALIGRCPRLCAHRNCRPGRRNWIGNRVVFRTNVFMKLHAGHLLGGSLFGLDFGKHRVYLIFVWSGHIQVLP